ncbi:hypothetical protein [Paenibacillus larvae]|uniref:hypothetical protein n=1 Tax=Paenibacillus larvae TaxID=1464 RepID=UPI0039905DCC
MNQLQVFKSELFGELPVIVVNVLNYLGLQKQQRLYRSPILIRQLLIMSMMRTRRSIQSLRAGEPKARNLLMNLACTV